MDFARRVDILIEILNGRTDHEDTVENLIFNLQRAKELAPHRNVLAHNPLFADIYMHKATGDVAVERAITSARNKNRVIDLPFMKELASDVEDVAAQLWIEFGKVREALENNGNRT